MNLNGFLIGSENPKRLVEDYTKLFGNPNWDEGGYVGWLIGTVSVTIAAHDQVKGKNTAPGRLIWNIETTDVEGQVEEVKTGGATVGEEALQLDEAIARSVQGDVGFPVTEVHHVLPVELVRDESVADALGCLRGGRLDRLAQLRQRCVSVLWRRCHIVVNRFDAGGLRGRLPCGL